MQLICGRIGTDQTDRQDKVRKGQKVCTLRHRIGQQKGEGVCERGQKKRRVSKKGPAWQVRLMIHDY